MPMVSEANAMSEELDMKMFYEIVLISPQARGLNYGRTKVRQIFFCFDIEYKLSVFYKELEIF